MKQGHKILLFSTVILGSVVAGTTAVHADVTSSDVVEPSVSTTQVVTKQDQATKETTVASDDAASSSATDTNTVVAGVSALDASPNMREAVAPTADATPASSVTPSDNSENPVTVSLDDAVATIHYDRPASEKDTTILHSIWSEKNGQDDIEWLPAGPSDTKVDLEKHGGYGVYNINSYKAVDGNLMLFSKASVTYADPVANTSTQETPHVDVTTSVKDNTLTVNLKRDQSLSDALVQYAVWSEANGKDDIQWYVASQTTTIDLSKHKGFGKYYLQTYAWLDNKPVGLASNEFTYNPKAPVTATVAKASTLAERGTYNFTSRVPIKDEASLAAKTITYFDKGMSVNYDKTLNKEGHQWISYISYAGNRRYVDLGALAKAESTKPATETTKPAAYTPSIAPSGTYHFTGKAGIKSEPKVVAADLAYYDKGMSVNYDKVMTADGHEWISYISFSGNRRYIAIGQTKADAQPTVAKKVSASVSIENVDSQKGRYDVVIKDVVAPDGLNYVVVPTWTDKGGQDDIQWPHAVKQNDGSYRYTVEVSDHHNERGLYHSHVYLVTPSNQFQGVGALSTTLEAVKETSTATVSNLPASGTYTFAGHASIKAEAKVSAQDLAYYDKGMSVNYDKTLVADNHQWLSYISFAGNRRYVDLGVVAKAEPAKPAVQPVSTKDEKKEDKKASLPSSGTYTFTGHASIKAEPKVSAQELAYYDKGMSVNYDKTLTADGKNWISYISHAGNRRYIAVGDASQASSPAPAKPAPAAKDEPANFVAARLAFAQHGSTSNFDVEVTDMTGKGTVHFAVWNGQNGQDDLKWYDMKRVGDKFVGSFDMNQHRGNGPLYIHAYYQEKPGDKMQFVRGLQF